jgi:glycosyltransferase involved in cell wall biosynthesis
MSSDTRRRVLFIAPDRVGPNIAGPAIRYRELTRQLGSGARVTIAAPEVEPFDDAPFALAAYEPHAPAALLPLIRDADVVVTHPQWPLVNHWLRRSRARVVYDLSAPETLELLELLAGAPAHYRRLTVALSLDRLDDALRFGDHFICASEKQRDLWLGAMLVRRLITTERYDADPTLRSLIDVVAFGVPNDPPPPVRTDPIAAAFPAIPPGAEIVLWNGGIWNWLDAPAAVRAFAKLATRRPQSHLVFMGTVEQEASQPALAETRAAAAATGLLDRRIFFNDGWVPYEQRADWLARAACAVATHRDHLETRYAFRTRFLDCFWTGLPIVCSAGDELGALVAARGLGASVAPGDDDGLADALEQVLSRGRDAYAEQLAAVAREYRWSCTARPLVAFAMADATPTPPAHRQAPAAAQMLRTLAYRTNRRAVIAVYSALRRLRD